VTLLEWEAALATEAAGQGVRANLRDYQRDIEVLTARVERRLKEQAKVATPEEYGNLMTELNRLISEGPSVLMDSLSDSEIREVVVEAAALKRALETEQGLRRTLLGWRELLHNKLSHKLPSWVGSFGLDVYQEAKTGVVSEPVADTFSKGFLADFPFSGVFMALFGYRADTSHPDRLAFAGPGDIINPGHAMDMANQMVLQSSKAPIDYHFDFTQHLGQANPYSTELEDFLNSEIYKRQHQDTFSQTMGEFFELRNKIPELQLGHFLQTRFKNIFKTFQMIFAMGWATRVGINDLPIFVSSMLGDPQMMHFETLVRAAGSQFGWQLAGTAVAFVFYQWIWIPVRRATTLLATRRASEFYQENQVKLDLDFAIRSGDREKTREALDQLQTIYANQERALPDEFFGKNLKLLDSGAKDIMQFMIDNPAHNAKPNGGAITLFTFGLGVVTTTYFGTLVSVMVYGAKGSAWAVAAQWWPVMLSIGLGAPIVLKSVERLIKWRRDEKARKAYRAALAKGEKPTIRPPMTRAERRQFEREKRAQFLKLVARTSCRSLVAEAAAGSN
jgi:hypothetical protein